MFVIWHCDHMGRKNHPGEPGLTSRIYHTDAVVFILFSTRVVHYSDFL